MATFYSYDNIYKIYSYRDNHIRIVTTQDEGMEATASLSTTDSVKSPRFQLRDERGLITIPSGGTPRVELAITRPNGTEDLLNCVIENREKSIVSCPIRKSLTEFAGEVKGEIRLITTNAVTKFYGINFFVYSGVSDSAAAQSARFSELIAALQQVGLVIDGGSTGTVALDTVIQHNGTKPVASGIIYDYLADELENVYDELDKRIKVFTVSDNTNWNSYTTKGVYIVDTNSNTYILTVYDTGYNIIQTLYDSILHIYSMRTGNKGTGNWTDWSVAYVSNFNESLANPINDVENYLNSLTQTGVYTFKDGDGNNNKVIVISDGQSVLQTVTSTEENKLYFRLGTILHGSVSWQSYKSIMTYEEFAVDNQLSSTSINPVCNSVITSELNKRIDVSTEIGSSAQNEASISDNTNKTGFVRLEPYQGIEGTIPNNSQTYTENKAWILYLKNRQYFISDYDNKLWTREYNNSNWTSWNELITVDNQLSSTSINPVQNKVIKTELDKRPVEIDLGANYNIDELTQTGFYRYTDGDFNYKIMILSDGGKVTQVWISSETSEIYIRNGEIENNVVGWGSTFTLMTNNDVLMKNNTNSYTPVNDYNPATKKYVDDCISALRSELQGGN